MFSFRISRSENFIYFFLKKKNKTKNEQCYLKSRMHESLLNSPYLASMISSAADRALWVSMGLSWVFLPPHPLSPREPYNIQATFHWDKDNGIIHDWSGSIPAEKRIKGQNQAEPRLPDTPFQLEMLFVRLKLCAVLCFNKRHSSFLCTSLLFQSCDFT